VRRRILRIDVAGGRFSGASGTTSAIRHGRSSEVQAALYTGAQPIGGHYREFPDEISKLYRPFKFDQELNPHQFISVLDAASLA